MNGDDADLARRFAGGDEHVMRDVYRRFGGPAFTVALRALGDRQLAEEAVQEGFVKAWQAAGRYDPTRPLSSWLFTIVKRTAIDIYRRERRSAHSGHDHDDAGELAAVAPPSLEDAWEAWQVRLAVQALTDKEQQVVRLAHFGGMTHEEIAQRLALSVGTVKSRSHRAHRRLASQLAHLNEEQA